jgi:NAD(P)-dependent dehydrogenase (short-subunit alcohol dehydrogenase family)
VQLKNRVVLITGGKRVGVAVAREMAARGADVALCYRRSRGEAETTAVDVRSFGQRAAIVQADLTLPEDCARLIADCVSALGRLDVLINMASVYVHTPFDRLDEESWRASLDIDLGAAWRCARAAVPHMRALGGGHIVNFSDWTARAGRPRYKGYLSYYVAKAAVIGLTEALALELADDNILVNAVAPGPILPPPDLDEDDREAVAQSTPLGRWGGEGEIARVVAAIVESEFMTGETIRVDGGRHLR